MGKFSIIILLEVLQLAAGPNTKMGNWETILAVSDGSSYSLSELWWSKPLNDEPGKFLQPLKAIMDNGDYLSKERYTWNFSDVRRIRILLLDDASNILDTIMFKNKQEDWFTTEAILNVDNVSAVQNYCSGEDFLLIDSENQNKAKFFTVNKNQQNRNNFAELAGTMVERGLMIMTVNHTESKILPRFYFNKVKYMGCYIDHHFYMDLNLSSSIIQNNTIEKCITYCRSQNAFFAGLMREMCKCGDNYGYYGCSYFDTDCNDSCPGNAGEICGGSNRSSIYSTSDAGLSHYAGCYADHITQRNFPSKYMLKNLTTRLCSTTCYKNGYLIAGVQHGNECWCGNNFGRYDKISKSHCNLVCQGNNSEICGGMKAKSVMFTSYTLDEIDYRNKPGKGVVNMEIARRKNTVEIWFPARTYVNAIQITSENPCSYFLQTKFRFYAKDWVNYSGNNSMVCNTDFVQPLSLMRVYKLKIVFISILHEMRSIKIYQPEPFILIPKLAIQFIRAYGDIRLINGRHPGEGRVEVFFRSRWGGICGDNWTKSNAAVVCRSLGFDTSLDHLIGQFGQGKGVIWLNSIVCNGLETSIIKCNLSKWKEHECTLKNDAGVICKELETPSSTIYRDNVSSTESVLTLSEEVIRPLSTFSTDLTSYPLISTDTWSAALYPTSSLSSTDSMSAALYPPSSLSSTDTWSLPTTVAMASSLSPTSASSCFCPCSSDADMTSTRSVVEVEKNLSEMVNDMKLEKKTLSRYIRKKTSATDSRPSARAIGCVGVILLMTPFSLILLYDFVTLVFYLHDH